MVEDEKVMMEEKKDENVVAATESTVAATDAVDVVDADFDAKASPNELHDKSVSVDAEKDDVVDSTGGETLEEGDVTFGSVDILADEEIEEPSNEVLADLQGEIATLQAELEERSGLYKRIAADFENFRRRTQREKEDLELQVKISTITELLPVIDNFERARSQIKPQTEAEMTIHKSYQGVYKQLVDCLKRIGVSPMPAEGQVFDPNLHEAVMREATTDYDEGIIIEDLRRGYKLGDRVLRHAMVKVAAAMETSDKPDQPDERSETE